MSDLIDRQAAIDCMMRLQREDEEAYGASIPEGFDGDRAAEALMQLPSVQTGPLTVNFAREMDRETIERLKDEMKNAPVLIMAVNDSVQPEQRWIPCSERLPEDYEEVLVWFEYFRYGDYNRLYQTHGIGDYSSKYDSWMINHETGWSKLRVFAWMPLPEPYKEDQR